MRLHEFEGIGTAERTNRFSLVSVLSFVFGGLGAVFALGFQYWAQSSYYIIEMGGKPHFEFAPAIILTFECTILLAAIGAFAGFLISARLPRWPESQSFPNSPCHGSVEYTISLDEAGLSTAAHDYIKSLTDSGLAELSKEPK